MECPDCGERMDTALVIETEDEQRPVYTDHQWWRCDCGARVFAVLVEDKTNIFNDDLDHRGYRPDPEAWERTRQAASACSSPRDKSCRCPVHQSPPRCWGAQVW